MKFQDMYNNIKYQSINHNILPKGRSFTANSAFSTLPSSQPFCIFIHSVYHNVVYNLISSAATSFAFTIHSRASFSRHFRLSQWPSQFLSLFLSVPALFLLLPHFLVQLHFYFVCPFYTFHPSSYPHLKCFQSFLFIPSYCPSLCTIQRYTLHKELQYHHP